MGQKQKSRTEGKKDLLSALSGAQALQTLWLLHAQGKEMARAVEEAADQCLRRVSADEVAEEVRLALEAILVEEVWDGAGPSHHGYRHPDEVAWELLESAVEPYAEDLKRYQNLGMDQQATELALGILRGIYDFAQESASQFKEWVPDGPQALFTDVLTLLRAGAQRPEDRTRIEEELSYHCPCWLC